MYIFVCGQLGYRYKQARNMVLWEVNVKAEGYKRNYMTDVNNFRRLAAIVVSPYAKKGQMIDPRKIWPIEGEVIPKASDEESYRASLDFFRNRNWKVKKVIH